MDLGEGDLFPQLVGVQPPSESNISDVLQAIEAVDRVEAVDPAAAVTVPSPEATPVAAAGAMYSGGGMVHATGGHHSSHHRDRPHTVITEQPASKALRFRYECEGRSAGSIPGVRSTSENKTFPTIQVMNYVGRAVVVVSCVTADRPHKPHPHNLVGKEMCKDGVCTSQINPETMQATFNNLGIQCVKKKDIEEALRTREAIRVDPFKTGFSHRSQPQSIDLNALRLCFQVFLEQDGKFKIPLAPVVSDIIYDKKAMSDLLITRLSHCSASVAGGQEVVLLCEKVAKDDISVWMVELKDDGETVVWESRAEINLVHKQVAIGFRTPAYRDLQVQRSIKAHVQLVRPSDNAKSAPRPFELRPISGTTRSRGASLLSLLATTKLDNNKLDNNNNTKPELASADSSSVSPSGDSCSVNISDTSAVLDSVSNGNIGEDLRESLTSDAEAEAVPQPPERSLDDLLDQVAELDEIYSENRTRLEQAANSEPSDVDMEDFNDAGTYTSLQLAFKNPVSIAEPDISYEDVQTFQGPIIEFSPLKRDPEDEKVPPLPPKRIRKAPSVETIKLKRESVENLLKPGRPVPLSRSRPDLSVSEPALPPPPPKKRSFLSRLFRRRNKSPQSSRESEVTERRSRPVGRSVSSVSGQRPSKFKVAVSHTSLKDNGSGAGLSYADSITHISLHEDSNPPVRSVSTHSLRRNGPAPPIGDDTILVAETVLALSASDFKKLQDDLDLTEAEHYALYMSVAPHATASEFDETSCYYSPVDGNKFQQQS